MRRHTYPSIQDLYRWTFRGSTRGFAASENADSFSSSHSLEPLNGRHVPRGYDEVDGTKRENGIETPLPDQARIGLADTVYLQFDLVR